MPGRLFPTFIKIQRCPLCTYSRSSNFTLDQHRAKCRYEYLSQNIISTAITSYTVLLTLQRPSSNTANDHLSDYDSVLTVSEVQLLQGPRSVTRTPTAPAVLLIGELGTFLDTLARKIGVCMANM